MHKNTQIEETLLFCMGFEGYLRLMKGVSKHLRNGVVNKTVFQKEELAEEEVEEEEEEVEEEVEEEEIKTEEKETKKKKQKSSFQIKQQYYPPHKDEKTCVRNDVTLDTYGVITGPNASGKTTYLKNTAINVILSQQLGIGFYESCTLRPYSHIHSYLNIPDTSSRDSLFQAESRRCKEILEMIQKSEERHFCIFDELFSGTNPKEATKSAYAFLEYLRKYTHVDLFLTTHYVTICDHWKVNNEIRQIQNYQMTVKQEHGKNIPTYLICTGISRVEGALGILEDLEYPKEMINMITDENSMCSSVNV
jgi:DNA mismatch repair protein MutS